MHRSAKLKVTDLNPFLSCILCGGYFVDATTIIECLHSFCRACIVRYLETSKYCPVCEVQVHKSRPLHYIRSDKTLQDIVYKLVPGLFHTLKESRDAEDRGECLDEKFIYAPDEVFSLSVEYGHGQEDQQDRAATESSEDTVPKRRFLRCPAAVTVAHLKKFVRMKYGIPNTYQIDLSYNNECLLDDYTLMDVAYIFLWKRSGPMRFFFKISERPSKRLKVHHTATKEEPKTESAPDAIEADKLSMPPPEPCKPLVVSENKSVPVSNKEEKADHQKPAEASPDKSIVVEEKTPIVATVAPMTPTHYTGISIKNSPLKISSQLMPPRVPPLKLSPPRFSKHPTKHKHKSSHKHSSSHKKDSSSSGKSIAPEFHKSKVEFRFTKPEPPVKESPSSVPGKTESSSPVEKSPTPSVGNRQQCAVDPVAPKTDILHSLLVSDCASSESAQKALPVVADTKEEPVPEPESSSPVKEESPDFKKEAAEPSKVETESVVPKSEPTPVAAEPLAGATAKTSESESPSSETATDPKPEATAEEAEKKEPFAKDPAQVPKSKEVEAFKENKHVPEGSPLPKKARTLESKVAELKSAKLSSSPLPEDYMFGGPLVIAEPEPSSKKDDDDADSGRGSDRADEIGSPEHKPECNGVLDLSTCTRNREDEAPKVRCRPVANPAVLDKTRQRVPGTFKMLPTIYNNSGGKKGNFRCRGGTLTVINPDPNSGRPKIVIRNVDPRRHHHTHHQRM